MLDFSCSFLNDKSLSASNWSVLLNFQFLYLIIVLQLTDSLQMSGSKLYSNLINLNIIFIQQRNQVSPEFCWNQRRFASGCEFPYIICYSLEWLAAVSITQICVNITSLMKRTVNFLSRIELYFLQSVISDDNSKICPDCINRINRMISWVIFYLISALVPDMTYNNMLCDRLLTVYDDAVYILLKVLIVLSILLIRSRI